MLVVPLFFSSALDSLLLLLSSCFTPSLFPFRLGLKISGRDLLLVEECCNAPDPMSQVSSSYSSLLPCLLLACCTLPCHHLHFISCHHVHLILHTCLSHASELFPRCPFCNPALLCSLAPPFVSRCERVLNFLGMARGLPSGLGIAPVDHLSSFVPFRGRLILQRLTG